MARRTLIEPQEAGRRLRAARAYAAIPQPKIADLLGVNVSTLVRMEKGELSTSLDELVIVGCACGLSLLRGLEELDELKGET